MKTNIIGLISAVGLAVLVSLLCDYNFFLMLLLFVALYFAIGIAVEFFSSFGLKKVVEPKVDEGESAKPLLPRERTRYKYLYSEKKIKVLGMDEVKSQSESRDVEKEESIE